MVSVDISLTPSLPGTTLTLSPEACATSAFFGEDILWDYVFSEAINAALLALAEAGARVGVCEDARVDGPIFDIVKGRVRDGESDLRDLEVRIGEGHRAILEPPILVLRELSLRRSKLETSAVSSTR